MCGIDDKLKPSPFITKTLLFLSSIIPKIKMNTSRNNLKTNVIEEFQNAINNSSHSYKDNFSLATIKEMYITSIWIENIKEMKCCPIFLAHGLLDCVTTPKASEIFYNKLSNSSNKLLLLENSSHNLLVPNKIGDLTPIYLMSKIIEWIDD